MFYECSSLKSIDLSSFNTTNVNIMDAMFLGCYSLKKENDKIGKNGGKIMGETDVLNEWIKCELMFKLM